MTALRLADRFRALVLLLSAVCVPHPAMGAPAIDNPRIVWRNSPSAIPNRFMVKLKESGAPSAPHILNSTKRKFELAKVANELAMKHGGTIRGIYPHTSFGFAIDLPEARALALAREPSVDFIEQVQRVDAAVSPYSQQVFSPYLFGQWGLDRIDGISPVFDAKFRFRTDGSGIRIYVLDTMPVGTVVPHGELGGRFTRDHEFVPENCGDVPPPPMAIGASPTGDNHGTFVSAVAAGTISGVAKNANVYFFRTLCDSNGGDTTNVVAALEAVHEHFLTAGSTGMRAVVNMSLRWVIGYETTPSDNDMTRIAIDRLVNTDSMVVVVAAGNDYFGDACQRMPARLGMAPDDPLQPGYGIGGVITVGATTTVTDQAGVTRDRITSFSNSGNCIDIFAPGQDIRSVLRDGNYSTWSGTSFSAPLTAGVVAARLENHPFESPSQVEQSIKSTSCARGTDGYPEIVDPILNSAGEVVSRSPNRVLNNDDTYCVHRELDGTDLDSPEMIVGPSVVPTGSGVTISWSGSQSGVMFQLLEARSATFSDQSIVYTGQALQTTRTNLAAGTYFYRVRACDAAVLGCGAYRALATAVQVATNGIVAPTIYESTGSGYSADGQYWLWWTSTASNLVFKAERSGSMNGAFNQIYSGTQTSLNQNFSNSGERNYRVKACKSSQPTLCSDYSNVVTVLTDFGE